MSSSNMETAYLILGSNLGDRTGNCAAAVHGLEYLGQVLAISSLYQTAPWGKADQPEFINQAVALQTLLTPHQLLQEVLRLEEAMGRMRSEHWGARLIDIDIALYGSEIIDEKNLKIPHPQLLNRRFALMPLAEIAGQVIHPISKTAISEHLKHCPDSLPVHVLKN